MPFEHSPSEVTAEFDPMLLSANGRNQATNLQEPGCSRSLKKAVPRIGRGVSPERDLQQLAHLKGRTVTRTSTMFYTVAGMPRSHHL
jgi:hypothetical protein